MQGANDVRTFVHGAEQAEARGDHAAAERLLRRALVLQELSHGATHPEVANTLNNLAIVCEMNGKLSDAEACYRRAYAIAVACLPPGDQFVTTSRENLEQFCEARDIPLGATPASPTKPVAAPSTKPLAPPTKPAPPPTSSAAASPTPTPARDTFPPRPTATTAGPTAATLPRHAPASPPPAAPPFAPEVTQQRAAPPRPPASATPRAAPPVSQTAPSMPAPTATALPAMREHSRGKAVALMSALLLALIVAGWFVFDADPAPEPTTSATASNAAKPSAATAAPSPTRAPSSPAPAPPAPSPEPARSAEAVAPRLPAREPSAPSPKPAPSAPERSAATTSPSSMKVIKAELCRSLTTGSAWRCTPPNDASSRGTMYFFTQVASPRDTTIEHRWYRDDRLHQRVPLRIRANLAGFRTYSRTTINADRTGTWKVELRGQDGQVLDQKTFAVK